MADEGFDPNAANTCSLNAADHVIEIDWTTAQRTMALGAVFANGNRPTTVKLEVYKSAAWAEVYSTTDNRSDTVQCSPVSPNSFGITKVRWTFAGLTPGKTAIEVERLWMFEAQAPGKAYAPASSPTFTGIVQRPAVKRKLSSPTVTADYTVGTTEDVVIAAGAGAKVVAIPTAGSLGAGRTITLENVDGGAMTYVSASAIDATAGGTPIALAHWAKVTLISTGTVWYTI